MKVMGRKKKYKKREKDDYYKKERRKIFELPTEIKQMILGILMMLLAVIVGLSFFNLAGSAGTYFTLVANSLIGITRFLVPLILVLGGLVFLNSKKNQELLEKGKKVFWPVVLASMITLFGLTGSMGAFNSEVKRGGWMGHLLAWPFLEYLGFWATQLIFIAFIAIGGVIFWHYLKPAPKEEIEDDEDDEEEDLPIDGEKKQSFISKMFTPRIKEVPHFGSPEVQSLRQPADKSVKLESKPVSGSKIFNYAPPPLNLLEPDRGAPTSGDTKVNSAIIQKTLHNFNIDIAMSEISIGPTVTQYTFKPAEGIKLSKITGLSNDLALALASHPIRIEAPIPGRALVGIEVPNKGRAEVRLRNLIENEAFQKSDANLNIALGRDVSGVPVYTDLTRMPHLLVAGATGTGKTIFLNTLILSLLYQPSTGFKSAGPETLRMILVDPKRVEFPVYSNIPHLLCPILYDANQTIGALRWLTGEMERRFEVLAEGNSRNIGSFNEKALKNGTSPLPFIVVVIDELADLMAAKGREIEAGIVRLAQMARAVGIHLVVATQRPSVEVITGLIKANITSRVTFQVASQVDSRTIIDASGAEKLLGAGDLLYISSYTPKPKRIQGSYVSEKEVRRVIKYIVDKSEAEGQLDMDKELMQSVARGGDEMVSTGGISGSFDEMGSDSLFEDAKRLVIESKKASASFLQRRLRVGYARAARLIDMLEDSGVVGPADGAKPRDIFSNVEVRQASESEAQLDVSQVPTPPEEESESEWEKV